MLFGVAVSDDPMGWPDDHCEAFCLFEQSTAVLQAPNAYVLRSLLAPHM